MPSLEDNLANIKKSAADKSQDSIVSYIDMFLNYSVCARRLASFIPSLDAGLCDPRRSIEAAADQKERKDFHRGGWGMQEGSWRRQQTSKETPSRACVWKKQAEKKTKDKGKKAKKSESEEEHQEQEEEMEEEDQQEEEEEEEEESSESSPAPRKRPSARSSGSRAKAKAKAKAKAASKARATKGKDKKSTADKPPVPKKRTKKEAKEKKGGEKATFAKRYRPTSKANSAKFEYVRDVYNSSLRKFLSGHTWCEDRPAKLI